MDILNKNLILEINSQNNEFHSIITVTPWGIEGSSKLINYEEGSSIYFGYETILNRVCQIIYILLIGYYRFLSSFGTKNGKYR